MPILRSIPSKKIINGIEVKTSEVALISESNYTTTGEYAIVIKTVEHCDLLLDIAGENLGGAFEATAEQRAEAFVLTLEGEL